MERHHPEAACQLFTVPSAMWCTIHSTAQQTALHGVICSVRHFGCPIFKKTAKYLRKRTLHPATMKYFAFTAVVQLLLIAPAVIYRGCDGSSGWKRRNNARPTQVWTLTAAPIAALKRLPGFRWVIAPLIHRPRERICLHAMLPSTVHSTLGASPRVTQNNSALTIPTLFRAKRLLNSAHHRPERSSAGNGDPR